MKDLNNKPTAQVRPAANGTNTVATWVMPERTLEECYRLIRELSNKLVSQDELKSEIRQLQKELKASNFARMSLAKELHALKMKNATPPKDALMRGALADMTGKYASGAYRNSKTEWIKDEDGTWRKK
jgi:hypothetical protein